jgi:hypothetical protein
LALDGDGSGNVPSSTQAVDGDGTGGAPSSNCSMLIAKSKLDGDGSGNYKSESEGTGNKSNKTDYLMNLCLISTKN